MKTKKAFFIVILLFSLTSGLSGSQLVNSRVNSDTVVINKYASVIDIDYCLSKVVVDNTTGFLVNDKVLLIQMKGAQINTSNTNLYGNVEDYKNAGNYEIGQIEKIEGHNIYLKKRIVRNYDVDYKVQLVKIPVYDNYTNENVLTCKPWDGETGGIFIILVNNTFTLHKDIDVSGKGYRGGKKKDQYDAYGHSSFYYALDDHGGARKGEGIFLIEDDSDYECGKGANANGGGGGNGHNRGGGGGANFGTGGIGGKKYADNTAGQGIGGKPVAYNNSLNKIFMGGGGGAGDMNDNVGSSGGNGGGIVVIISMKIAGNNHFIKSNGEDVVYVSGKDGSGGGGAGGTVLLDVPFDNNPSFSIQVNGGKGGDDYPPYNNSHGPGGGGGGGLIRSSHNLTSNIHVALNGGEPGKIVNPQNPDYGTSYGAASGSVGGTINNLSIVYETEDFVPVEFTIGNDTAICQGDTLILRPDTVLNNYHWQDGSTDSVYYVFSSGIYWLEFIDEYGCSYIDSVYVDVIKQPRVNLGPDTSFCANTPYLLHAGPGYNSYLWQDGSADSIYLVDTSGIYWITVENECGTASDTVEIDYVESFQIDLGSDTSFCYGKSITLSPGSGYINYYWQDGSGDTVYVATQSGIYWVQVTDSAGCTASDTVTVETFMTFDFSIGNDTTICYGDYIFLNGPEGYASYLWQDGSGYNSFIADTAGIYWLEITDTNNCAARDSLLLQTDKVPAGILGTDTLMCKDSVKVLRTVPAFEQYFWQDSSQDSIYIASEPGKYWVMVFDTLGCSGSDTITLSYPPAVTLELKREGYLCEDDSVLLTAISNYDSFIWQDSSTSSYFVAKDSGTYWVSVTNGCETKRDTIIIDACSSIWIPNVFTPNNDGYNDYFYAVAKNISKFKMEIFNRWGQVLAILNSIDEKWDGTYKGRPVAEGTYFWVADFEQMNSRGIAEKKRLQGSVTLLR